MTYINTSLARRSFLAGLGSATALSSFPLYARGTGAETQSDFNDLLHIFSEEMLTLQPDNATTLGLDSGIHANLKSELPDLSATGDARWRLQALSMKARLAHVVRSKLDATAQLQHDTVSYAIERGLVGTRFFYAHADEGFTGGATPYVVSQQDGAVFSIPEFLNSQHQIKNAADAEAYLARIRAFAKQINQETVKIADHGARGVMPPDFICKTALGQLKDFRAVAATNQPLVTSLAERAKAAGIAGDWTARAARLVETEVYPALDGEIAAFAAAAEKAPSAAGVGRLPDGEAYYRWALGMGTTTTAAPAEVHRVGLEQNAMLLAKIDALLRVQGMTKGSVGERLQALNKDTKQLYPNTDAGRADLIAFLNERIGAIREILPKISHLGLKADVHVKRVPVDIQDGAALGYMNFGSLDGTRPNIYYINLKNTDLWPRYILPTITAHEGVPGHSWQGAYLAEHHAEIPVIYSLMQFNAFVEGWALYAEQLVDEHGLYDNDPFGRIGYLQAQQFRACRLVVDTGLHAMGWSREQSIKFLAEQTGKTIPAVTSETDRYCVSPGQACSYKTGHNEILRLRAHAKAVLASRFDVAAFDDVLVKTGGVPLTILAQTVERYINSAKS